MLTVLIASFNGAPTLPKVLAAYCALLVPAAGWRLIVVDNGSDDATRDIVQEYQQRLPLTYLYAPGGGKNAALNAGVEYALQDHASELLVFSDDDASPEPHWLVRLAACAAAHPDYAVFGGAIVPDWAAPPPDWVLRLVPLGLTYAITAPALEDGPVFPGLVWGPNMALRRSIFDAGQRFDASVGPNGVAYAMGSETLFTRRLFAAGYLSWFCPGAQVSHFIRARQLGRAYLLQRAWRSGRGNYHQDRVGNATAMFPMLFKVPRWMWHRLLNEVAAAVLAWLRRDAERLFLHRWDIAQLTGYLYEAWSRSRQVARRVLITSYSGELGGMEMRMGQEARVLSGAGYATTLALRRFPGFDAWAATLRADQLDVRHFDPPRFFEQWRWRRLNKWRAQTLAARRLRGYQADLVHVAFCWTTYGASALWLAHHCGLPTVISVHNAFPMASISAWHQPLLVDAFRSVRGIYAVSASALVHFLAIYRSYIPAATRLAVIPNSVDTGRFAPSLARRAAARRRLRLADSALVLGSVGRLSEQKRPAALLQLFCALAPDFPTLHLVLVGSGPLEPALRDQARASGLSARIVFTGFSDQVEDLLPAFDLHLLLSRNEGFGIATIEAMACGVAVVGTDVPGTADILRGSGAGAGLLVPLDDPAAVRQQVAALLGDAARRQAMGEQGRSLALAHYGSARLEQQVLAFYRDLV